MYNKRVAEAPERLAALEIALKNTRSDDVTISYAEVSLAFPSPEPHPNSFDYPIIDHIALNAWAKDHGWNVRIAREIASNNQTHSLPVRFTRNTGR